MGLSQAKAVLENQEKYFDANEAFKLGYKSLPKWSLPPLGKSLLGATDYLIPVKWSQSRFFHRRFGSHLTHHNHATSHKWSSPVRRLNVSQQCILKPSISTQLTLPSKTPDGCSGNPWGRLSRSVCSQRNPGLGLSSNGHPEGIHIMCSRF